ncbi:MAG TPA: SNF2-related protein, partial [Prosthecobacter sp.]|nr:SNF2-related protein [Prosthecobacter sp.]
MNANGVPRQKEMEVTEKWLGEIGGWAAMKAARGLVDAGMVAVQSATEGLIRGLVGSAKTKFACGLRIRSRNDVDNLCTCPTSRRGVMCEHSLAVALAWLKGEAAPSKPAPPVSAPSAPIAKPSVKRVPGRYSVFLPDSLLRGEVREPVNVYVKFEPGGEAEESRLAAWLAEQGVQAQSAPISLRGESWRDFLQCLPAHPRVQAGRPTGGGEKLEVAEAPVQLPILIESAASQEVQIRIEGGGDQFPVVRTGAWWLCRETLTLFAVPPATPEIARVLQEIATTPAVRRSLPWLVAQRSALADVFQVELSGPDLENFHVAPVPCDFELHVDGSFQTVDVTLTATFQGQRWNLVSGNTDDIFPIQHQAAKGTFYVRDRHVESRLLSLFSALGFKSTGAKLGGDGDALRLANPDSVLAFFASELPRLRQQFKVIEGDRWRAATRGVSRIVPQVRQQPAGDTQSGSGGDWLAMEFGYEAPDGFRLPRAEVLRLVRSGQRSVQGKQGRRYLLDLDAVQEFEETLRDVPLQLTADGARLNSLHAPYLFPEGEALLPPLVEEDRILADLGDLGAKLRPYQLLGTRWMQSLTQAGRGGILGDEMGLGKTVQSIAVIRTLVKNADARLPILIVCPKSLVGNWHAEFERFAPDLKVAPVRGSSRGELLKQIPAFDVIITTYQLIIRDLEVHMKQDWRLILLDEASYIRNPDTEASKALRQLRARARLALTGTPVENSTRDLWSIYQFVLPGYLGSRETFRERFEQPIHTSLDTPAGQAASQRLKKLIRPYFLRRTKREVLRDLPEKIEQVLWCDPSSAQMEVYRRLLEEGREEIKAARRRSGQNGAKMTMFTVLLRLRQACCDLRLTGLRPEALSGLDHDDLSGKWAMLMERIGNILDSGGKVLVFSQFVSFLRLLRERLDAQESSYCYLDGSSQDREGQVTTFQTDPSRKIFLISLKAGGYGLNLTAADHVILLDPWWNPAVEA